MIRSPLINRANARLLALLAVFVIVAGLFAHDSFAYYCIAVPVVVQTYLWFSVEVRSVPVLPILFILLYIYYAVPMLRSETAIYTSGELITAGAAIGGFLVAAAVAALPFLVGMRRRAAPPDEARLSDRHVLPIVAIGLASGIVYDVAVYTGSVGSLGSAVGAVRSAMLTLAAIACYLIGYARGRHLATGARWLLICCGLSVLLLLSVTNLLLSDGMVLCLAVVLGYVLTAGRVPWPAVIAGGALLFVLHAGKFEVRDQYWNRATSSLKTNSLGQIPGMMSEWLFAGIENLGSSDLPSDFLERASLLQMVLLVQRNTPELVPYLGGETYTQLPEMLLPRFVDEEKPVSQAGLNLLSIRYGLQTEDSVGRTTIGWGLVAEALANFGIWSVLIVGAAFGALAGAIMWLSAGGTPTSSRMLIAVPLMLVLANLEANFAYLLVSLMQAGAAAVAAIGIAKFGGALLERPRPSLMAAAAPGRDRAALRGRR